MASVFRLIVSWACSLAILVVAGCSRPSVGGKKLPVSEAELGELIAAVNEGRIPPRDIEDTSPLWSTENEATEQAHFLMGVALDQRDPRGAESAYGKMRDTYFTAPGLLAAGQFRRAELLAVRGAKARASAALARARESIRSPHDQIWMKIGGRWQERPFKEAAEPLYQRIHGTTLTYRGLRWLAARLPGSGVWRLLLAMAAIGLMLRILEAPLFVKLIRRRDNTVAYRNFCIFAFVFVEVISILWYTAAGPDLIFAFDACVRWWVSLIGYVAFMFGGAVLVLAQKGIGEAKKKGLAFIVYAVAIASLALWFLGLLSVTGLMGCLVMLLTGTLPAVLYAAKR